MSASELFMIAVGLSADAFAAAVCKGLALGRAERSQAAVIGAWFGAAQALMPLIGAALGVWFGAALPEYCRPAAGVLLFVIGLGMLSSAWEGGEESSPSLGAGEMLPLAAATSIDALAVGMSLALVKAQLVASAVFIGAVTFVLSFAGARLGGAFGEGRRGAAKAAGGMILIVIGIRTGFFGS